MGREIVCHFCGVNLPDNEEGIITRVYVKERGANFDYGWERSVCSVCLKSRPRLKARVIRKVRIVQ